MEKVRNLNLGFLFLLFFCQQVQSSCICDERYKEEIKAEIMAELMAEVKAEIMAKDEKSFLQKVAQVFRIIYTDNTYDDVIAKVFSTLAHLTPITLTTCPGQSDSNYIMVENQCFYFHNGNSLIQCTMLLQHRYNRQTKAVK